MHENRKRKKLIESFLWLPIVSILGYLEYTGSPRSIVLDGIEKSLILAMLVYSILLIVYAIRNKLIVYKVFGFFTALMSIWILGFTAVKTSKMKRNSLSIEEALPEGLKNQGELNKEIENLKKGGNLKWK
jgi:hypothetical protein